MTKKEEQKVVAVPVVTDLFDGTFLSKLYDSELKLREPNHVLEPEEKFVGEMTPLERRLWSLVQYFKRLGQFEMIAHDDAETEEARKVHLAESEALADRVKIAGDLMWRVLRDRLVAEGIRTEGMSIGVRVGWKVVIFKTEAHPMEQLLKGLLPPR